MTSAFTFRRKTTMSSLIEDVLKSPAWILRKITLAFSKPVYDSKVFCIGFNKTGTTSCGKAIQTLGTDTAHSINKVWSEHENG